MRCQDQRRAAFEFHLQVLPFVPQLTLGFIQSDDGANPRDFLTVEPVTAPRGFFVDGLQKCRHRGDRIRLRLKADQLRMMPIAPGFPAQNFLREQRLAPECNEPFGIEIFRVQSPQTHNPSELEFSGRRER